MNPVTAQKDKNTIKERQETYSDEEIQIQSEKTLKNLKFGRVGIIFTPTSAEMLWKGVGEMKAHLNDVEYECIVVIKKGLLSVDHLERLDESNLNYVQVSDVDTFAQKNIGRQLLSSGVKYMLFLDTSCYVDIDELKITEKFVKARIAPLYLEKTCAVVGEMPSQTLSEEIMDNVTTGLAKKVTFDMSIYEDRCLTKDGRIRFAESNSMAVAVEIWDMFGGFNINADYPAIEYCLRVQLLGYKIILQQI